MVVVVAVGQPLTLWWRTSRAKGSFPHCKRDSIRLRVRPARSVLVEAEARPAPTLRVRDIDDGSVKVQIYQGGDRTDDLQAEARAMARASNASVYSPQLLVGKYGSRPVKVHDMKLGFQFVWFFVDGSVCVHVLIVCSSNSDGFVWL